MTYTEARLAEYYRAPVHYRDWATMIFCWEWDALYACWDGIT